jgi:hypothetical protein
MPGDENNNRGINRGPESQIEGKFHFHYSREEREQGLSEKTREVLAKRKGSWWRRNPGQAFTLLDIVIIALVVVVLFPLVNFFSSRPSLGGYTWDGSYFILGDGPDIIILTGEGSREGEVPLDLKILSDAGEELYQGSYPLAGDKPDIFIQTELSGISPITLVITVEGEERRLYFEGKDRSSLGH